MYSKIISFFSTKSVQAKIISGSLSDGQLFIYFYFIFMYDALGLTQQCLSMAGKQPTVVDMVNIWGYLIITGIGLLILFLANGGLKGKNFVSKFFAFSFTVGFKYGIALILLDLFSPFIFSGFKQSYDISVYLVVNLLMVVNIAFRIHETQYKGENMIEGKIVS